MTDTVLILEHDDGIAERIRQHLIQHGHVCEVGASADEAIERLATFPRVALIVFDYQLGDNKSGLEFYRRAVASGWNGLAILLTDFENQEIILDALRSGVDDVFPKTPDFLESLSRAVQRLLDGQSRRVELEFLKSERMVHERVEAAFKAAQVGSWAWVSSTRQIHWAGSPLSASLPPRYLNQRELNVEQVRKLLGNTGWSRLLRSLAGARRHGGSFECELPVSEKGEVRWWLVRGAWHDDSNSLPSGIAVDVTERKVAEQNLRASMEEVRRLNHRLKFSITETHHRVKNSLQVVSSLLSMEFRRGKGLDESGLWRLMGHVRALAALHDLLTDRSRDGRDLSGISVTDFLRSLEGVLRRLVPHLEVEISDTPLELAPRRASSLAVIVTELVMNAAKFGEGTVGLSFSPGSAGYILKITNGAASEAEAMGRWKTAAPAGTGLELVNTLLKSDFSTELQMHFADNTCIATFSLPKDLPPDRPHGAFH